jgi:hypothetical protein
MLFGSVARAADEGREGIAFFEREVVPVLEKRCFSCHSHESGKAKGGLVLDSRSGWETGGKSGTAIVPGNPGASLLIKAVHYQDEDFQMPPKEKLPDSEIALLEKWIAMGAPDSRQAKTTTPDLKKLWALQPIAEPAVPEVKTANWARGEIDAFLLARLEQAGLTPAPDADPHTLLRRVTFDLTGLPPTPEEIAAFLNDTSAGAYDRVVDRLLGSAAFGDHWARHWFDLSCYADLADIQGDVLIRDAWRYRDYVIAAFNADKPLDRFIHEQIAGDLLPSQNAAERRELIIATGYLAIGPWTLQNYIKGQLDADVVDHQIDRIGRTFLGQTISCARCHDHKFDPIPTADYYALAGIFHSTRTTSYDGPGVWSAITHVPLPQMEAAPGELEQRRKALEDLGARRQILQAELTPLIQTIPGATSANVIRMQHGIAANGKGRIYEVGFGSAPSVWGNAEQRTTAVDGLQIDVLRGDGSILAGHLHQPGPWSGTKDAQELKPAAFTYTGDGSGDVRLRITTATPGSGRFGGAVDNLAVSAGPDRIFADNFDGLVPGATTGEQADTKFKVLAGVSVPGWEGAGTSHSHAVDLGGGDYAVQFFGGDTGPLASAKPVSDAEKMAHTRALELQKEVGALDSKITLLNALNTPDQALAVRDVDSPADGPIYKRGNFLAPGSIVPRGFLSAVPVSTGHAIAPGTSGRLQLAQWLTDPANPLTPRVLANRLWHHLFGKGLVRSVDYFGVHGELPSHPDLLDFLALRLRVDDRWSLKKSVRRMVTARAYQMASTPGATATAVDPDNRLLWQMPRRRLSAEVIRDAMLAASGELDPGRGGPNLGLELPGNIAGAGGNVNPATWGGKIPETVSNRRTIYFPMKRERPQGDLEILSTFDFPHPNEITGARPETTVATQALFLMNAPFVKARAQRLAERLAKEESGDERARINRLYLLTVNRPADPGETGSAMAFLDACTAELSSGADARSDARAEAWTQLCHALLGSNHFLFRE